MISYSKLVIVFCVLLCCNISCKKNSKKKVEPNYKAIAMQSWQKQNWEKALDASTKIENTLFYYTILSDYLLRENNHENYIDQVDKFIQCNPNWPKNSALLLKAEQYLYQLSKVSVVMWCKKHPVQTIHGKKYYLQALITNNGDKKKIKDLVKSIWTDVSNQSDKQDKIFYERFAHYLSYQDHLNKITNLLDIQKGNNAKFVLSLLKETDKKMVQCRILLQQKNFTGVVMYNAASNKINPGLLYDYLIFNRNKTLNINRIKQHIKPLFNLKDEDKNLDNIINICICYTRELVLHQELKLAYKLITLCTPKINTSAYVKVNHLAGIIALKLHKKDLAYKHFLSLSGCVLFPSQASRNYYFMYLCKRDKVIQSDSNIQGIAAKYLKLACRYKATFYGQIASIGLNKYHESITNNFNTFGSGNLSHVYQELEFIYSLAEYRKYNLADLFITALFKKLTKQQICKSIVFLNNASTEINWQMMLASCALNRNIVSLDSLFPSIALPLELSREDRYLANAVIRKESVFDPNAVSGKTAIGLMQLTQESANFCAMKYRISRKNIDIYDPRTNVDLGLKYIKILKKLNNNSLVKSIAAYHAGRTKTARWCRKIIPTIDEQDKIVSTIEWIESIPFFSTQDYIHSVIRNKNMYFAKENNEKFCILQDLQH